MNNQAPKPVNPFAPKVGKLAMGRTSTLTSSRFDKHQQEVHETDAQMDDGKRDAAKEIVLHEAQERAIDMMNSQKYCCVIGAAGTGKTEVLKQALPSLITTAGLTDFSPHKPHNPFNHVLRDQPSIAFLAFTNRVVGNMANRLGEEYAHHCFTIHKFLRYTLEDVEEDETGKLCKRFQPQFTEFNKHDVDILVIDEIGVVSEPLLKALLAATPAHTRIYVFGDINQLRPVGGRPVISFLMEGWPTVELTHIYRQEGGSPIIDNSQRILMGKTPIATPGEFDMIPIPSKHLSDNATAGYVYACMSKFYANGDYKPLDDAFMTYVNEGRVGQIFINEMLRDLVNSHDDANGNPKPRPVLIDVGNSTRSFAPEDRVVSVSSGAGGNIPGMPSGTAGFVRRIEKNPDFNEIEGFEIDEEEDLFDTFISTKVARVGMQAEEDAELERNRQTSHIVTIYCPDLDKEVEIKTVAHFGCLLLGWAGTVHRNQGLQHRTAFILLHPSFDQFLSREWLYTAVTRAIDRVVIFYHPSSLAKCLAKKSYTGNTAIDKAHREVARERKKGKDMVIPTPAILELN